MAWIWGDLRSHLLHSRLSKNFRTYPERYAKKGRAKGRRPPAPWRQSGSPGDPEASCEDSSPVSFRGSREGRLWIGFPPPAAEATRAPGPHRGSCSSQLRASAGSPDCLSSRRGSKPEVQPRLPQALLCILYLRAGIICTSTERGFPFLLGAVGTGQQQQCWVPKSPPLTMPGALP